MNHSAAASPMSRSPEEWASVLKLLAAGLGVVAGLWKLLAGPVKAWRKRHEDDSELREAGLELARRSADTLRFQMIQDYGKVGDPGFLAPREQDRRAAILLDDLCKARARLWKAIGMPDPEDHDAPELSTEEKRLLLGWRQTMRLEMRDLDPDKRKALLAARAAELVMVGEKTNDQGHGAR